MIDPIINPNTRTPIAYRLYSPAHEPKSLALLCPGFADSKDYLHFRFFGEKLAKQDYLGIAFDPTGTWESGGTPADYCITNYLADVRVLLNTFKKTVSSQKIVIIGHSLGGAVVLMAGEKYDDITHIISLTPPPDYASLALRKQWSREHSRMTVREDPHDPTLERVSEFDYRFVEDSQQYSPIESLTRLRKPTLLLVALDDEIIPYTDSQRLSDSD